MMGTDPWEALGLLPAHARALIGRGISPGAATARGYTSARIAQELTRLDFAAYQARAPALVIPVHNPAGLNRVCQIRPDHPRMDADGRSVKYDVPRGSTLGLDVSPVMREALQDASRRLWITEGILKGDALASAGEVAVGLLGVWGFRTDEAIGDLNLIPLRQRYVYVAFDSDVMVNGRVQEALRQLVTTLGRRGAYVFPVYLPEREGGGKMGIDDALASGWTVDRLIACAENELRLIPCGELEDSSSASGGDGFIDIGALLALEDEEVAWRVDGLLVAAGTSILVAREKTGKTVAALNLAVEVSQAGVWLGRECVPGPALYLAHEGNRQRIKQQLAAIGARDGDPLKLYFGSSPDDAERWLEEAAARYQPVLIVVDTLQKFSRVPDLNDYARMVVAMQPFSRIAQQHSAHLMLLHHSNRHGAGLDSVMGSGAIGAEVDTVLVMRRTEDDRRTIRSYQRYHRDDDDDMPETVVEMDRHTFRIWCAGIRQEVDEAMARREILRLLSKREEPLEAEAVLSAVQRKRTVKLAALATLLREGLIARARSEAPPGQRRPGRPPYCYWFVKGAQEVETDPPGNFGSQGSQYRAGNLGTKIQTPDFPQQEAKSPSCADTEQAIFREPKLLSSGEQIVKTGEGETGIHPNGHGYRCFECGRDDAGCQELPLGGWLCVEYADD